jgi:CBS domain-containing protein
MKIQEMMKGDVKTVTRDTPIKKVAATMRDSDIGSVLVVDHDKLVGVVTDRDIVVRGLATRADLGKTTAKDVMSPKVYYCFDDQSVDEVLENMGDVQMRRLAVVDRNKSLVGIVSLSDLSRGAAPGRTQSALGGITAHR